MSSIFLYYSSLAPDKNYHAFHRTVFFNKFGACSISRNTLRSAAFPESLKINFLLFWSCCSSGILFWMLWRYSLAWSTHHWTRDGIWRSANYSEFSDFTSIDWPNLAATDPDSVLWVHFDIKTGVDTNPLLSKVSYVVVTTLDFETTSRQTKNCFRFYGRTLRCMEVHELAAFWYK